ncbi:DUF5949 family protein [Streptomyces sp. NPDC059788]|uniref:DUF5949 family protein n=1 Tax=Streptomyces sp. NPDC059788 TaxID=3346948 RepID=UPI0036550677
MTTSQTTAGNLPHSQLGTLMMIGWSGAHPEDGHDVPFLLAYSLGDGKDGPEAGSEAMGTMLSQAGLLVGGELQDASRTPGLPLTLIVEAGRAVLTMPIFSAQCPVPPEWLAAADHRGQVYGMFATRPWPQATPGGPVSEDMLRAFAGDEGVIKSSAHCLIPVRRLQGSSS